MSRSILIALLSVSSFAASAQKTWHLKDPAKDGIYGVGMDAAYTHVQGKTPTPIVVAVIDIGTDINHEKLKSLAWTNPNEIPGNGIDDDKNGYVDDMHGWNFLGGKTDNIMYEASEETRVYQQMLRSAAVKTTLPSGTDKKEIDSLTKKYVAAQKRREEDAEEAARLHKMARKLHWKILIRLVGGKGANRQVTMGAEMAMNDALFNSIDVDSMRISIVGDEPQNAAERYYGNNNVVGPEASHGTHVAGIIASVFYNGQLPAAANAPMRIMALRAVPWGDERDKDVANAIRYAVDNGAKVINMSFGKTMSPNKDVVDAAIAYAMSKDVLLVHGSGNDAANTDSTQYYPLRPVMSGHTGDNWLEVGATRSKGGEKMVASFSNYGRSTVDIFAPGEKIYSTLPGNNYGYESGTSMAAPVVAGVAAWIRSYFPYASAADVKKILMKNSTSYEGLVKVPGKREQRTLKEISVSGGIVNAAKAAEAMAKRK